MDYANPLFLIARKIVRKFKIKKFFSKFLYGKEYEIKVEKALFNEIRTGDYVWDIGSNIGHYISIFWKKVGPNGKIFAYEPHPITYQKLKNKFSQQNIICLNLALSNKAGILNFSDKKNHEYNSIVNETYLEKKIIVEAETSDNIVKKSIADIPNVIKIDVEGHELSVLQGMKEILTNKKLRCIMIEVHYQIMDNMNLKNGVKKIVNILKLNNYKLKWVDPSHLLATRK